MNTNDAEILEQQRQRRKRINRMKTGIVLTIAIWMIVSLLAIMILTVQVIKLNSKVYILEIQQTSKVSPSEENASNDAEVSAEPDPYANVITGINSLENMAKDGDKHRVYLTFDCNPGKNTEAILDVLARYNVKATFFVVGDETGENDAIYQRIVNEGHTLGMNSYSNQYSSIYSSTQSFEEDYTKISNFIYEKTGIESKLYRFPGGSSNRISNVNMAEFVRILNQKGVVYFDWNVSAGDTAVDYTVDDVISNVTEGIMQYKTSVVLLHDDENKTVTVEALEPLINQLKQMHADILPIDENTYVVQYIKADSVE